MESGKSSNAENSPFAIQYVAVFALVVMLIGFLIGRAVLSIGMIIFVANAVLRGQWHRPITRAVWLLPALWVALYALSGFWSENLKMWWDFLQLKLPVALMLLAFCMLPPFDAAQRRGITLAILAALVAGMCYSLVFYIRNPGLYEEEANHSLLIPTLAYGNHIVFSMATALGMVWAIWMLPLFRKAWRVALIVVLVLLAGYLHMLAAKTGLLLIYCFAVLGIVRLLLNRRTRLAALGVLAGISLLLTMAYQAIPTFRGRIDYTLYSARMFLEGDRTGNYSDVGRVLSWKVGARVVAAHPLGGTGAGDWQTEMATVYAHLYPAVSPDQYLIPHNQFLATAVLAGIPAAVLLLAWFVVMIFLKSKTPRDLFFKSAIWLMLFASMFVDALLEVQFGVFVFLFFGLLAWHHARVRDAPKTTEAPDLSLPT